MAAGAGGALLALGARDREDAEDPASSERAAEDLWNTGNQKTGIGWTVGGAGLATLTGALIWIAVESL